MQRKMMMLALTATALLLPGCVFAVGSTHESQPGDRLDRLETRVRTVEQQLGIPAPAPAAQPAAQDVQQ